MDGPRVFVDGLVIHGDVVLPAAADQVFDALTTPQWLQAWWGDEETYTTRNWVIEPREGAAWHCDVILHNGQRHRLHGEVLRVQRPLHLQLSWHASWLAQLQTELHIELQPHPEGTLLRLRHHGFHADFSGVTTFAATWPWVLRWLQQDVVQAGVPGETAVRADTRTGDA